ncbi:hypothetical protein AMK26_03015 [Streptomyces sp. CB03234]|uniref:hypothetical protein n=1 Tax=Streptomyces sp. (strain CB03234) TaxID=1703937 RepID=UPI0009399CB7|nr:hypothetical protein [Streptomyces sp. CB03234]OKK08032.1 hypothetical protein AMK26_03015 [Streptomyces sp. CB03234]
MQFSATPDGGEIVAMDAREALVLEGALSLYVLKHPDSNVAIAALRAASAANEAREARMEEAADRASV